MKSYCSAAAGRVYWAFQGRDAKVLRGCLVWMFVYADVSGSSAPFKKKTKLILFLSFFFFFV